MPSKTASATHPLHSLRRPGVAAGLVLVAGLATFLAALGFEHLGGYAPCPLCLQERYAYYAGLPLTLLALIAARSDLRLAARLLLALVALFFLINAGLGIYHSGVEWHWWPGPATCGTVQGITSEGNGLLDALGKTRVIACDEAPWRFLGLSFAGWNAVISAALAGLAAMGAAGGTRRAS